MLRFLVYSALLIFSFDLHARSFRCRGPIWGEYIEGFSTGKHHKFLTVMTNKAYGIYTKHPAGEVSFERKDCENLLSEFKDYPVTFSSSSRDGKEVELGFPLGVFGGSPGLEFKAVVKRWNAFELDCILVAD